MGRSGSTASRRARQMRRVLARWQRSGLTLREFGEQREIPLSTLTWWRQVFRRAGEQLNVASKGALVLELTPRQWKRLRKDSAAKAAA